MEEINIRARAQRPSLRTKHFAVTSSDARLCLCEHKPSHPLSGDSSVFFPQNNCTVKVHHVIDCGSMSVTTNVSNRGLDIICS